MTDTLPLNETAETTTFELYRGKYRKRTVGDVTAIGIAFAAFCVFFRFAGGLRMQITVSGFSTRALAKAVAKPVERPATRMNLW